MNIRPTKDFVLIQFTSKDGTPKIVLPQGQRNPNSETVVVAFGPDVPQDPPIKEGSKVLLRGDAKIFGVDDNQEQACVQYATIMAIVED